MSEILLSHTHHFELLSVNQQSTTTTSYVTNIIKRREYYIIMLLRAQEGKNIER
jgi:hypothetical protein